MTDMYLIILQGDDVLEKMPLTPGSYTLGRDKDSDIVLDDKKVSRRHAKLNFSPPVLLIEDDGSTNGIIFEGVKTPRAELTDGQQVVIKPYTLELRIAQPGPVPPLPSPPDQILEDPTITLGETSAHLMLVDETGGVREHTLQAGTSTVGRGDKCAVRLAGNSVSRHHADLGLDRDGLRIKDAGSTWGIKLNGRKVTEAELAPNDRVMLGKAELKVLRLDNVAQVPGHPPPPAEPSASPSPGPAPGPLEPHRPAHGAKRSRSTLAFVFISLVVVAAAAAGGWWLMRGRIADPVMQDHVDLEQNRMAVEQEARRRMAILLMAQVRSALERGDLAEAEDKLERIAGLTPGDKEAASLLETVRGEMEKRRALAFKEARERRERKQKIVALLSRISVAVDKKDLKTARALADDVNALDPGNTTVAELMRRADKIEKQQSDARAAKAAKEQAVKQKIRGLYEKGIKLSKMGRDGEAMRAWGEAIRVAGNSDAPYAAKAHALISEARQRLARITAPVLAKARNLRAAGNIREAIWSYREVLNLDPNHAEAKEEMAKLVETNAKTARNLYDEGRVYENVGDMESAVKKWQEALTLTDGQSELAREIKARLTAVGR